MAFASASHRRWTGTRRLAHSRAILRNRWLVPRTTFTCLLAALFLFSTLAALRPAHAWPRADAAGFSEVQAALGSTTEELLSSICHHGDEDTSGIPGHNHSQPCKTCPFCTAFHHLPPVPDRGFECAAHEPSGSTTFFLYCHDLPHVRQMVDQRRPRAPPLA